MGSGGFGHANGILQFGNDETFHFFIWVTESGQVDVDALIAKAFDDADGDFWLESGMDVCVVVQEKLTDLLSEVIEELKPFGVGLAEIGSVGKSDDSLLMPLLALALERICSSTVAMALLIRAHKWAPSKERPKAI